MLSYYTYDRAGRGDLLSHVNGGNGALICSFANFYDANGNVIATTQEAGNPVGQNKYYSYDALDRRTLEEWKTGSTLYYGWLYNFDPASNRYFKHDERANSTTYYSYDATNKLEKGFNQ